MRPKVLSALICLDCGRLPAFTLASLSHNGQTDLLKPKSGPVSPLSRVCEVSPHSEHKPVLTITCEPMYTANLFLSHLPAPSTPAALESTCCSLCLICFSQNLHDLPHSHQILLLSAALPCHPKIAGPPPPLPILSILLPWIILLLSIYHYLTGHIFYLFIWFIDCDPTKSQTSWGQGFVSVLFTVMSSVPRKC